MFMMSLFNVYTKIKKNQATLTMHESNFIAMKLSNFVHLYFYFLDIFGNCEDNLTSIPENEIGWTE